MKKSKYQEPVLETSDFSFTHDVQGGCVVSKTTFRRRGYLSEMEFRVQPINRLVVVSGRAVLEDLQHELRALLEDGELPNDKSPVMPTELDHGYDPAEHGIIANEDVWIGCLRADTQPLSRTRIAGELLHLLNSLRPKLSDELNDELFRAMELYAHYFVSGEINTRATEGKGAADARAQGPRARSEKTREARALILELAHKFWKDHPNFVGRIVKTAESIAVSVNEMRAQLDPRASQMAAKTIADHLSAALRQPAGAR